MDGDATKSSASDGMLLLDRVGDAGSERQPASLQWGSLLLRVAASCRGNAEELMALPSSLSSDGVLSAAVERLTGRPLLLISPFISYHTSDPLP